jgi:hypothetical protein
MAELNGLVHAQVVQMVNLIKRLPKEKAQFLITDLKEQLKKEGVDIKW